jgi:integrase
MSDLLAPLAATSIPSAFSLSDVGKRVVIDRARVLGPETGKTTADLAFASAYDDRLPPATLRAYQLGQRTFVDWCADQEIPYAFPAHSVTPAALALFVDDMAARGLKPATVSNYVSGVSAMHRKLDIPSPAETQIVRDAKKAMKVAKGSDQTQATPMRRAMVDAALAQIDGMPTPRPIDLRDAALIAVAYDTLARASELVAFDLGDIIQTDRGAVVAIRRSKTDQEGRGKKAALLPDTMRRVRAWLATGQDREGPDAPLFPSLSHKAQNDRLRRRDVARIFAKRVGPQFSAHSARVGTAQDMLASGFNTAEIAQAGRWASETMPLRYAGDLIAADGPAVKLARLQGRA